MFFSTSRYEYIDSYDWNLELYVENIISTNGPLVRNEDWRELPILSHGITAALDTLHVQGIQLSGQLNPRTVLIKQRGQNVVPQVILPKYWNAFNNECEDYVITNTNTLGSSLIRKGKRLGRLIVSVVLCTIMWPTF